MLNWRTQGEMSPPRHARYLVRRGDKFFTATPCYGMHAPWWVVRTMAEVWPNEADPVAMHPEDRWVPIEEAAEVLS